MSDQTNLDDRLRFMRLDDAARSSLRRAAPVLMAELPGALDAFYGQIRITPQTRAFFPDEARIARAKDRQIAHWRIISAGQFDEGYVRGVTTVGQTHARIGLEPRWYIGGYALLLELLIASVLRARWPKERLGGRHAKVEDVAAELGALAKAALLDVDYSITVYLEAAEAARLEAEKQVLANERATVVRSVGEGLAALAAGDLAYRMSDDLPPEYRKLREDFNAALAQLEGAMGAVAATSGSLSVNCEELAKASDNLSMRTEQQAAGLEQAAAALDEVSARVRQTAGGANQASRTVAQAKSEVERSGQVVASVIESVTRIEESSREIGQIIGVIDEIAFQTNLLALNAGVEAARAGDSGRGFAVVAAEVRALAQRSAEAAKEIKSLISVSNQQVATGVELVHEAGAALQTIVTQVAEIDSVIASISASTQEQSVSLAEVSATVGQMDQVVQQNAAMVEQSTAATHAMKAETLELDELIRRFRLRSDGDGATAWDASPGRTARVAASGRAGVP